MKKLNFGCGARIANGWTNIDFQGRDSRIKRVNLLKDFPYPNNYFDMAYSSHVLEHFTQEQAGFLLAETYRVLKPGGILRIVVPDLEGSCREYLRILALPDADPSKSEKHEWIIIEILDQLVRSVPGGKMRAFYAKLANSDNRELVSYVCSRTESAPSWNARGATQKKSFFDKIRLATPQRIVTEMNHWYLKAIARLVPRNIRQMVFVGTRIGERHRWMYDRYGLKAMLEKAGFCDCKALSYNESAIPGFLEDLLDSNADGSAYKNNSLYMESRKGKVSSSKFWEERPKTSF